MSQPFVILIVDDTPNNLFTLRELLKRVKDCEIIEANSGTQALARVLERSIDLILLDVQMPGMDGFETARHLQMMERTRTIPIVFVTAVFKAEEFAQRGYQIGAVDYLAKPIDDNLLLNRVRLYQHIQQRELQLSDTVEQLHQQEQALRLAKESVEQQVAARTAELAQQGQRLSNILWATGVGTWEWNVQTGEAHFNERWAELMGYTLEELTPISIATWKKSIHPDDLAASDVALKQHFSGTTDAYDLDARVLHKQGHWIWVNDKGRVTSRSADGKALWMAGIHFDITARKQAEAALAEKAQELQRSNRELEQFSYSISHDMRQPLRMISSYMQLLQKGLGDTLDAEKREYFNFAIDGAKRMDAMMLGLLEYSRVGRKGEPPAWVESRTVLNEALLFLRPSIAEAQAEVHIEGTWPRVLVSPDETLRLLQNLIGNALKFRVANRVPQITVSSTSMPGGQWQVCITDNGVGIAPDQIGRLFQVFQRLQSRSAYEGTGIGLALCRKIAERHDGRIWAESAGEGQGSRFCVELPQPHEESKAAP